MSPRTGDIAAKGPVAKGLWTTIPQRRGCAVILRALMRLLAAAGLIALLGARRLVAACFFALFAVIVLFDAIGRIARHVTKHLPTGEEVEAFLAQAETFLIRTHALLPWDGLLSWEAHPTCIGAACLLAFALATVYVLAAGRVAG